MTQPEIAYFSMEIALADEIPTYSGGLGVLAGDTLWAAADQKLPVLGVTLLHRKGYLEQSFDAKGKQIAKPVEWSPEEFLDRVDVQAEVEIEGRTVALTAWTYPVEGVRGHRVPVILLDADLPENDDDDRRLTDRLYGGDERYRLAQEAILGIGGRRILKAMGIEPRIHHLNEGHAALLALELLREQRSAGAKSMKKAIERVRERCVFTTHTPVPAGHDKFDAELAAEIIGSEFAGLAAELPDVTPGELNMTEIALVLSSFVNGVAERHAEVSREMFPGYEIAAITNGVHSGSWTSAPFRELFDEHLAGWRTENSKLRGAQAISLEEIEEAHAQAKQALLDEIAGQGIEGFAPDVFTIGFARRATPYKRATLLFRDLKRLKEIAEQFGGLQIVYAGKAHPKDAGGQALITEILKFAKKVGPRVRVAYLPNYGMRLGALITGGVDLWLNNPRAPLEASGTSGMKAVHNGVPNLSVRDGWWCEGGIDGVTGWTIEPSEPARELNELEEELATAPRTPTGARQAAALIADAQARTAEALQEQVDSEDAAQLYDLLQYEILPLYHGDGTGWAEVMRNAIALAAPYFTAQRMVEQYARMAYGIGD